MTPPLIPRSYAEWRHCITVSCRIPLTPDYVERRIAALADPRDHMTQRFVETWGAAHHEQVRRWFAEAKAELAAGGA